MKDQPILQGEWGLLGTKIGYLLIVNPTRVVPSIPPVCIDNYRSTSKCITKVRKRGKKPCEINNVQVCDFRPQKSPLVEEGRGRKRYSFGRSLLTATRRQHHYFGVGNENSNFAKLSTFCILREFLQNTVFHSPSLPFWEYR